MATQDVGALFIVLIHCELLLSASEDLIWEECSLTCGGGMQRTKANKNVTRMCNVINCPDREDDPWCCIEGGIYPPSSGFMSLGDAGCITTHFTFDKLMERRVYDTSYNANHGSIKGEASLDENGKFGKCLHLPKNSNISLGSETFHNRPSSAITIALWVKLLSTAGPHEMFHTCSSGSPSGTGQYHFEVNDGNVRWFHRDHMGRTVFNVESVTNIPVSIWTHVAGTYRTSTRSAKIYVNGESTPFSSNSQLLKFGSDARVDALSWDWGCANIGDYQNERPLNGFVDDFFIFKCELMDLEIQELFETGSFKRHGIPVP